MHLSTSSFSEHKALRRYYNQIIDLTDKFAEAYMGKYEQIKKFPAEFHSATNPVKYFTGLKEFVQECREDLPQDADLQTIIDEIADLVNSTLFKLRYLK